MGRAPAAQETEFAGDRRGCLPWLGADIELVKPRVIVCLGSTAAKALISPDFRVTKQRGEMVRSDLAEYLTATVHPSSIIRSPTPEQRHAAMESFVEDLSKVAEVLNGRSR